MPENTIAAGNDMGATIASRSGPAAASARDLVEQYASRPRYIPHQATLPLYVPLPSGSETERYSGLKRGRLNSLILPCEANGFRPPVKSISLKPPGALKGKRLIVLASLLGFLSNLEAEQASFTEVDAAKE